MTGREWVVALLVAAAVAAWAVRWARQWRRVAVGARPANARSWARAAALAARTVALGRSDRDTISLAVFVGIAASPWIADVFVYAAAWFAGLTGLDGAPWAPAGADGLVVTLLLAAVFDVAVVGLWRGVAALEWLRRTRLGRRWPGLVGPSLRHSVETLLVPALIVAGGPLLWQTVIHDAPAAIGQAAPPAACAPGDLAGDTIAGYGPARLAVAATIVQVGRDMGVPERGQVIAVATAMQESSLDPDAVGDGGKAHGAFQQHPSWASLAERHDPASSARRFYERLVKVRNYLTLPLWQASHAVQRSAHPTATADDEAAAAEVVGAVAGTTCTGGS